MECVRRVRELGRVARPQERGRGPGLGLSGHHQTRLGLRGLDGRTLGHYHVQTTSPIQRGCDGSAREQRGRAR